MKDPEDVQRLIGLKRYETPGDDYFQRFREEFKVRQRSELLRCSARGLLAERVTMWMGDVNPGVWLVPLGSAAAAIAVGVYILLPDVSENNNRIASYAETTAETVPEALPIGSEVITLQLPRPVTTRNPRVDAHSLSDIQGLITAGSKESFREL